MKICLCWFTSHNCQILWNPASAVFYVLLLEPYRFHLLLFLHGMRRAPCRDLHSLLLHCTWLIPSWILTPVFILDDACTSCRILPRLFLHCSWHYVILVLLFLHHMGLTTFWILPPTVFTLHVECTFQNPSCVFGDGIWPSTSEFLSC